MSWFDENNPNTDAPEDNEERRTADEAPDRASAPDSADSSAADKSPEPASWFSPPAGEPTDPEPVGSRADEPVAAQPGEVTYRYGVKAPDPVPVRDEPVNPPEPPPAPPYTPPSNAYNPYQAGPDPTGGRPGAPVPPSYPYGSYNNYEWNRYPQSPYSGPTPSGDGKPPKRSKGAAVAIAVLSAVCALSIIAVGVLFALTLKEDEPVEGGSSRPDTSQQGGEPSTSPSVNNNAPVLETTPDPDDQVGYDTKTVIQMNLDSTVCINTYTSSSGSSFENTGMQLAGTATGIVWKADGYIITNRHVVVNENTNKPYDKIDVVLYNKDSGAEKTVVENATVVGSDKYTDLAVIKVDASGLSEKLSEAEFGKSSDLELGDKVIAIGNAGGLNWSVSQGIVSGLARDVYEDTNFAIKCLQIDAAINPGNSGGPLINAHGKVVGINSAKIVATGYEGLGFSIPIDEASAILNDLAMYGQVKGRVMLGISGVFDSTPFDAFCIAEINNDSCLKGTAAKVGDYITHINDVRVTSYDVLRQELNKCKVGDTITLKLSRFDRQGNRQDLTVECQLNEVTGN